MNGTFNIPAPKNEPILSYAPGSPERAALKAELKRLSGSVTDIPAVIGGVEIRGRTTVKVSAPHRHKLHLADVHQADARAVAGAVTAAKRAWRDWSNTRFEDRAAILLKAAELLAGPWRATINAATMLGQSKTAFQAEIDSACEIIDFWRFNASFAEQLYGQQPVAGGEPGTGWITARSKDSSTRSRRSISRLSAPTCRPLPRSWGTRSCGSPRPRRRSATTW